MHKEGERVMSASGLECVFCHRTYPAEDRYFCDECGGILDVTYDSAVYDRRPLSQTFALMPVERQELCNMGVQKTPLIHAGRLGQALNIKNLYFKCEQANLTGSFKDRPVAVALGMAKRFGYRRVVAASSGNAAAATAACAARLGLECTVIIPASTPEEKVRQTSFYGAKVFKVEGPYSNSYRVAAELAQKHGVYNVTTTFLNPYAMEGDKLVGYELYEALGGMPDRVYVPVGAGPLLAGIYKALREYAAYDGVDQMAQMVAVQAEGNSPIADAFARGDEQVACNPSPQTIAGGIADGLVGYEKDGVYTLRLCKESEGAVLSVADEQIMKAQAMLAAQEGLFVEPSAAASLAGVMQDMRQGRIRGDQCIVAVLTGHGLKDMKALKAGLDIPLVRTASDIAESYIGK